MTMSEKVGRTTTVYMTEEDRERLARLTKRTGLTKSGLVRRLMIKAELEEENDQIDLIREHVEELAKLLL